MGNCHGQKPPPNSPLPRHSSNPEPKGIIVHLISIWEESYKISVTWKPVDIYMVMHTVIIVQNSMETLEFVSVTRQKVVPFRRRCYRLRVMVPVNYLVVIGTFGCAFPKKNKTVSKSTVWVCLVRLTATDKMIGWTSPHNR